MECYILIADGLLMFPLHSLSCESWWDSPKVRTSIGECTENVFEPKNGIVFDLQTSHALRRIKYDYGLCDQIAANTKRFKETIGMSQLKSHLRTSGHYVYWKKTSSPYSRQIHTSLCLVIPQISDSQGFLEDRSTHMFFFFMSFIDYHVMGQSFAYKNRNESSCWCFVVVLRQRVDENASGDWNGGEFQCPNAIR